MPANGYTCCLRLCLFSCTSSPASCRDKGRGRVDVGVLCLSSSSIRNSAGHPVTPAESLCHKDKHKAPTPPLIRPLSLQDGERMLSDYCRIRPTNINRTESG